MKIAIIDLGTNTFNLIIVDISGNKYETLFKTNIAVKLGEGGISKNVISDAAFKRGIDTIGIHTKTIKEFNVDKTFAYATSAIRTAKNRKEFVQKNKEIHNISINIIDGNEEAKLIYYGVKLACELDENPVLILDIGGGSNEFIIANHEKIFWKESFPIGVARLLEEFKPSNPMKLSEIQQLESYFDNILKTLFEATKNFKITTLLGSSGAFDTFAEMTMENDEIKYSKEEKTHLINVEKYFEAHKLLVKSTIEERLQIKSIEPMRVEMIVLASILVNYLMKKLNLKKIIQSNYSMKEGIVFSHINKLEIRTL